MICGRLIYRNCWCSRVLVFDILSLRFLFGVFLFQWFSNFFDSRHKKSLRFGRGTVPKNQILVRITQGCADTRAIGSALKCYSQIYDHSILWKLDLFFKSPKKPKIRNNLCWVEIFWHIFNILAAQYCATALSLRINDIICCTCSSR